MLNFYKIFWPSSLLHCLQVSFLNNFTQCVICTHTYLCDVIAKLPALNINIADFINKDVMNLFPFFILFYLRCGHGQIRDANTNVENKKLPLLKLKSRSCLHKKFSHPCTRDKNAFSGFFAMFDVIAFGSSATN